MASETGGVHVRPAAPADVEEIAALIRELAEFENLTHEVTGAAADLALHLFGSRPAANVLLAENDRGEVGGFALWFPTFSTFLARPGVWLEDLFVRPAFRGRGFGRALLQAVRDLTDGRVEWAVLDWNERAMTFYRSVGAGPADGWLLWRWPPRTLADRPQP